MSTYNIYLGNPCRRPYHWGLLCHAVQDLFRLVVAHPVVSHHMSYSDVMVRSTMDRPNVLPYELLIYVLPSALESLVGPHFKNTFGGPGVGGLTGWNSNSQEVGSEVNVASLIRTSFH